MDNVERLMEFGLTRHEASLYILLTLEGSLNGYEAAKQSGISRSNAYNALAGLVDKGAAYIQEEDTVRYTPVAIEEFCSNKIRHLEQKKTELIAELPGKRKNEGGYPAADAARYPTSVVRRPYPPQNTARSCAPAP